ncbi:Rhodanese-like domain-containing protein [Phyllosticta citrichinensis]|uniref:Rhodanese-like domain-containing protein n=1 Tax=Phyllosticta citrichinensis TaxID=1130410 RepID=A0ABR1Y431_9PEZI
MSNVTISTLKRIDPDALFALLQRNIATTGSTTGSTATPSSTATAPTTSTGTDAPQPPSIAIIDVRDSDYIGGHIRGCTNVPAHSLDWRAPELARTLRDVPLVVFHCALSQQRGPGAALRYLRERERLAPDEEGAVKEQDVKVLEGGFVRWQEKYGKDSSVTEGYVEDIWKYGY